MGPHVTSSSRFPRLLIAENNLSSVESLMCAFGDRQLHFDYDVCTSHDHAVIKLFHTPPPYQLVISSVQLAEGYDFMLLKHNRMLQSFVPFVVTASAPEQESARRVLDQGAFDLITHPVEQEQTVGTIRLALWHSKLRDLIASQETALQKYQQHIADYPGDKKGDEVFRRVLSAVEKTISQVERSILRVEQSTARLSDFATQLEQQTRKRALERLDGLGKQAL